MDQFPNQQEENLENQALNGANESNQLLSLKFENRDDLLSVVRSINGENKLMSYHQFGWTFFQYDIENF